MPAFPLGRAAGTAALGGLEIPPMVNNNFRQFCWLHTKTGPRKVGDVVILHGPWTTFGPLSRGFSQQDLPHQSFLGHSGHMAETT